MAVDYVIHVGVLLVVCIYQTSGLYHRATCPADTVVIDPDSLTPEEAREILMSDDPRYEGFHPSGFTPAPTFMELVVGDRPDVLAHSGMAIYQYGSDALNKTEFNVRRVTCRRRNLTDVSEYTVQVGGLSLLTQYYMTCITTC